jgi:peptidoglycan hydrolase-like protein with peptidoglycan-binding domain
MADPFLSIGSSGSAVSRLQNSLKLAGFDPGVDGIFGKHTLKALKAFQKAHHIESRSGIAGPQTWLALGSAVPAQNADDFHAAPVARRQAAEGSAGPDRSTAAPAASPVKGGGPAVHVDVPWISEGPPWTECKPTSIRMAALAGAHANENNRLTNPAQERAYIDSELNAHRPVVVGVDHQYGSGSKRHVVVITGRGTDDNGTYYTFNDPGSGGAAEGKDTRLQNRFRVAPDGSLFRAAVIPGPGQKVVNQQYNVWSVMKNRESGG